MSTTSRKRIASFPAALAAIESGFERTGERSFSGYVFDPRQPDRTFTVELLVDGYPVALTRADLTRPDAGGPAAGNTCHSFRFVLDLPLEPETIVEARIANLGTPVGSPIAAGTQPIADPGPGAIRWNGGLRFSGWLAATAGGGDDRATVSVDGQLVTEVRPSGWVRTGPESDDSPPARALDFHLPERFADGRLHRLTVTGADGARLAGCPLSFLAFPQGFAQALTGDGTGEILRAEFLDRLVPMSLPFSSYRDWSARFPLPAAPVRPVSVGVVAVGSGEMEDTLDSLEAQSLGGWVAASLSPTDRAFGFHIPEARAFLAGDAAHCDLFVFTPTGTRLAADALQRIAAALLPVERAHVAYADVEIVAADGSSWPVFFPAFDYDRLLEQGYCCLFFAIRRAALESALDAGASDLYRLFNSLHDGGPDAEAVLHLPGALATLPELDLAAAGKTLARASRAHLTRRTIAAEVIAGAGTIFPAARVRRNPEPGMVTVVIATRNRAGPLDRCLASIEAAVAAASARVIVVDNASTDPAAREHLAGLASEVAVLRLDEIRRMAAVANIGVTAADTGLVCLLGDQVEALDDDWLQELAGRAADADVGAAGPLLLAPQGMVANAGIVLGPDFAAAPAFADRADGDPGYGDLLRVTHQQSGLAASCMLVRRADWIQVGGMDGTRFPSRFASLDLCLRLRALGRRIVITPHARLLDHRPDELLLARGRPADLRLERELANLRARWGETLAADPFYSPLLSLDGAPFAALAWPPRPTDARTSGVVEAGAIPPGF